MEEKLKELSKHRYEKACDCLNIAIKLFADGEQSFAQNRAYYALFNAIKSVTILDEFDSSKHSGVIAYFNQYYVKTELFKKETSKIILFASMLREKSDYEDFYEPKEIDTQELISLVQTFLGDVKSFLVNRNIFEQ